MSRNFSIGLLCGAIALVTTTAVGSFIVTKNVAQAQTVAASERSARDRDLAWAGIAAQYSQQKHAGSSRVASNLR